MLGSASSSRSLSFSHSVREEFCAGALEETPVGTVDLSHSGLHFLSTLNI